MNKPAPSDLSAPSALKPFHFLAICAITTIFSELVFKGFENADIFKSSGRAAIVFLSLYTVHRFAIASLRNYKLVLKDIILIHIVILGSVCIIGLGRILALALSVYTEASSAIGMITPESIHFAIPFAVGGLVLQAVLGLQSSLVFALSLSLIIGIYSPIHTQNIFVPYVFIGTMVACLSLARFRSRSAYIKAGLNVAIVSLPFALASFITDHDITATNMIVRILGAFMNGALCTFIAAGITPVVEYLGGYVTDMRLIEMATLDHPLLKELSLQSPGTWNHSMVIGMMVEAAADEIGANPVLARVGAYFHDIGKMKKPLYFVENQGGGENRHNKLSTSMSALIIKSHVKDGIELARKHKLPEAIVDMIPQHHGTSLIEYFYKKACDDAEDSEEDIEVDKNSYTYPGPKPQTREAGLLMLADRIESSTRTLAEPSLDRIQGLVQKMINKVFASGQLNESPLTLQDLHQIAACFTRVLNSIYHQRITYAEPVEKGAERAAENGNGAGKQVENGTDPKTKRGEQGKKNGKEQKELEGKPSDKKQQGQAEDKENSGEPKEDLKRLGM